VTNAYSAHNSKLLFGGSGCGQFQDRTPVISKRGEKSVKHCVRIRGISRVTPICTSACMIASIKGASSGVG
jgi:hypothetical protein